MVKIDFSYDKDRVSFGNNSKIMSPEMSPTSPPAIVAE